MSRSIWLLPLLGVLFGGCQYLQTTTLATSAPQQAAGTAMAIFWLVFFYVLTRALNGLAGHEASGRNDDAVKQPPVSHSPDAPQPYPNMEQFTAATKRD